MQTKIEPKPIALKDFGVYTRRETTAGYRIAALLSCNPIGAIIFWLIFHRTNRFVRSTASTSFWLYVSSAFWAVATFLLLLIPIPIVQVIVVIVAALIALGHLIMLILMIILSLTGGKITTKMARNQVEQQVKLNNQSVIELFRNEPGYEDIIAQHEANS